MKWMIVLLVVGSAATSGAQAPISSSVTAPEIVNVGRGEMKLAPDRVSLRIGVVTHGASAGAAGSLNARRMEPLLAALRRQGIPDSAMSSTGYNVDPEYSDPEHPLPPSRAYTARNALTVTLTKLDALGAIVDTALAAGATEIAQVTFQSSHPEAARQRAIALAVTAARADAAAVAAAAGGTLGPIIEIVVDPTDSRIGYVQESVVQMRGVAPSGFLPAQLSITVLVRVRSRLNRE
jgi:uncharacterized protein